MCRQSRKDTLLRQLRSGDEGPYDDLFHLAFADEGRFQETIERTLPGGFFVVEHLASHELVASCVAMRGSSSPSHVEGQMGWLVTDPSHTRKGLGTIVSASVTNRLIQEGYERPFLGTEDLGLPQLQFTSILDGVLTFTATIWGLAGGAFMSAWAASS